MSRGIFPVQSFVPMATTTCSTWGEQAPVLMMFVSCATVAPLNVLTCVLPVESIRRLATFLRLECPYAIISLLQEWGRRRAGVESGQSRLLWLAGTGSILVTSLSGGGGGAWRDVVEGGAGCWREGVVVVYRPLFIVVWMRWPVDEELCVFGWGLCVWMAMSDLVPFLMSINLSSKAWHLLWSSICLGILLLEAERERDSVCVCVPYART